MTRRKSLSKTTTATLELEDLEMQEIQDLPPTYDEVEAAKNDVARPEATLLAGNLTIQDANGNADSSWDSDSENNKKLLEGIVHYLYFYSYH